jgi:hypothetical protein
MGETMSSVNQNQTFKSYVQENYIGHDYASKGPQSKIKKLNQKERRELKEVLNAIIKDTKIKPKDADRLKANMEKIVKVLNNPSDDKNASPKKGVIHAIASLIKGIANRIYRVSSQELINKSEKVEKILQKSQPSPSSANRTAEIPRSIVEQKRTPPATPPNANPAAQIPPQVLIEKPTPPATLPNANPAAEILPPIVEQKPTHPSTSSTLPNANSVHEPVSR